jgi:hypothetical protein
MTIYTKKLTLPWASPSSYGGRHSPNGSIARFDVSAESGVYEARWYAARGKAHLQEIARFKGEVSAERLPPLVIPLST